MHIQGRILGGSIISVASPPPPHWHVDQNAEWEKHYIFSTFETVLCTEVD